MKKFLSILLAAMMVLATAGVAFAEETPKTYTITINNAETGHTYEAYQIFTGDLAGDVLSNIILGDGVTDKVLTFDGNTYKDGAALAEVVNSEKLAAFTELVSKNLATVAGTSTETDGVYTITGLEPGYYFIKDADNSLDDKEEKSYTKFMVKIVKDITATPKTDKTSHEKKVEEDDKYQQNDGWGVGYNDTADYCIGDSVSFSLTSKVPCLDYYTHYEMIFHDTMSEGLTFNKDSVAVTVSGQEYTDFTVIENCDCGCTFAIKLNELINCADDAPVRVDFEAILNENAVIGNPGNPNESYLEFSNNPNVTTSTTTTPDDYVVVFTYKLDVTKVDSVDKTKVLKDAEFVLQNSDKAYATFAKKTYEEKDADGNTVNVEYYVVTGWNSTLPEEGDSARAAYILKSDEDGLFHIRGLDHGNYNLIETKAPAGYNLKNDPVAIKITADTTNGQNYADTKDALKALSITVDGNEASGNTATGTVGAQVTNNVGATLPETGGIGTTLFYLIGGLMAAGSALTLVIRRRADADEE